MQDGAALASRDFGFLRYEADGRARVCRSNQGWLRRMHVIAIDARSIALRTRASLNAASTNLIFFLPGQDSRDNAACVESRRRNNSPRGAA